MATTSPASNGPAADAAPVAEQDWPSKLAETIVEQVDAIRDKTTGPVLKGARYTVFAAMGISLGTVALIILLIGAVRALNNYLPGDVWAAYVVLGAPLFILGLALYFLKAIKTRDED